MRVTACRHGCDADKHQALGAVRLLAQTCVVTAVAMADNRQLDPRQAVTMNPFRWSFRAQFLLGFLACAGLLAYAIYVQLHLGLEPCPLCIFQRIAFAALAVFFLIGALHGPRAAGRAEGVWHVELHRRRAWAWASRGATCGCRSGQRT